MWSLKLLKPYVIVIFGLTTMKKIPTSSSSKHEKEGTPHKTRTKNRPIKQIMIIVVKEGREYDL